VDEEEDENVEDEGVDEEEEEDDDKDVEKLKPQTSRRVQKLHAEVSFYNMFDESTLILDNTESKVEEVRSWYGF
jgi:hypothetical protein